MKVVAAEFDKAQPSLPAVLGKGQALLADADPGHSAIENAIVAAAKMVTSKRMNFPNNETNPPAGTVEQVAAYQINFCCRALEP